MGVYASSQDTCQCGVSLQSGFLFLVAALWGAAPWRERYKGLKKVIHGLSLQLVGLTAPRLSCCQAVQLLRCLYNVATLNLIPCNFGSFQYSVRIPPCRYPRLAQWCEKCALCLWFNRGADTTCSCKLQLKGGMPRDWINGISQWHNCSCQNIICMYL